MEQPSVPRRHIAIVTCMDSRIDPLAGFGLEHGDAHILRNGGAFLILNYSYRGDPQRDLDDVATLARDNGLVSERLGTRDLALWDGITFLLRKRAA